MTSKRELYDTISDLQDENRKLESRLNQPVNSTPRERERYPYEVQVAVAAVILMLEDRAAHMAVKVGTDVSSYLDACEEIHTLRTFLDFSDDMISSPATALWERLAS